MEKTKTTTTTTTTTTTKNLVDDLVTVGLATCFCGRQLVDVLSEAVQHSHGVLAKITGGKAGARACNLFTTKFRHFTALQVQEDGSMGATVIAL